MIPKAVWKYAVLEFGVQSVITPGVTLMPMLYVDNLDTLVRVFLKMHIFVLLLQLIIIIMQGQLHGLRHSLAREVVIYYWTMLDAVVQRTDSLTVPTMGLVSITVLTLRTLE